MRLWKWMCFIVQFETETTDLHFGSRECTVVWVSEIYFDAMGIVAKMLININTCSTYSYNYMLSILNLINKLMLLNVETMFQCVVIYIYYYYYLETGHEMVSESSHLPKTIKNYKHHKMLDINGTILSTKK